MPRAVALGPVPVPARPLEQKGRVRTTIWAVWRAQIQHLVHLLGRHVAAKAQAQVFKLLALDGTSVVLVHGAEGMLHLAPVQLHL